MKTAAVALVFAGGLALGACASPAEQIAMRCGAAGQPGSPGYAACLQAEHQRQLRSEQQRLDEKAELDKRLGVGGVGGHM